MVGVLEGAWEGERDLNQESWGWVLLYQRNERVGGASTLSHTPALPP